MTNKNLDKILIADDKEEIRKSLADVFSDYEADLVFSAGEEIAKARENKYSLIITDNQMENENAGIYAIKEIRKFDKETPIIIYTSYLPFDLAIEALQAGATEAVKKEFPHDNSGKLIIKKDSHDKLREVANKYLTKRDERRYE